MRTIAFCNLKGGVGKTATVINVAAVLAADHRQRVLVIDADSQCNSTEFFGGDPREGNLANILRFGVEEGKEPVMADAMFAAAQIQPSNLRDVDLLAGDDSLMDLDLTKVETSSVRVTLLRDMINFLRAEHEYEWVLVDCPPAFNAASAAALIAVDEVVIPLKLDAFSLRGMANLMQQIANLKQINPALTIRGVLPTMWYRSDAIADAEDQIRRSGLRLFRHIRASRKVDDMTFAQEPLTTYSPRSGAGIDYRVFTAQLLEGGAENDR